MPVLPFSQLLHPHRWLLTSPPGEWALQRLRNVLIGALRQGPIPKHVAFVMDGNRRYAKEHNLETVEGHHMGFEALAKVLEVCYRSGVKVVTIYAFSIENFKRSRSEVEGLMDMAKHKLCQLAEHGELLQRYGVRIQILGAIGLVRPDVLDAMNRAMDITKDNKNAILNVCAPYTSRSEMTSAIRETVRDFSRPLRPSPKRPFSETRITRAIRSKQLNDIAEDNASHPSSPRPESVASERDDTEASLWSHGSAADRPASSHTSVTSSPARDLSKPSTAYPDPETISSQLLDNHTFTAGAPPLDLLIRTSGVQRLSDFMMWQCHEKTEMVFLDCLWPEFDLWQFLPVLVEWQWKQRRAATEAAQEALQLALPIKIA